MPRVRHCAWRFENDCVAKAKLFVSALQESHAFWRRVARKPGVAALVHSSVGLSAMLSNRNCLGFLTVKIRHRSKTRV
jgi:hypothetical protein